MNETIGMNTLLLYVTGIAVLFIFLKRLKVVIQQHGAPMCM